jgi:hypothetical protein
MNLLGSVGLLAPVAFFKKSIKIPVEKRYY